LSKVCKVASACGIDESIVPCAWGDPLGVVFDGLSLPDPPSDEQMKRIEADFAQWSWLLDDPLFELTSMTIHDPKVLPNAPVHPEDDPAWEITWKAIRDYEPKEELSLLLARGGLQSDWALAFSTLIVSGVPEAAFEASQLEIPEVCRAFARAIVAQLHVAATDRGGPGPSATLRNQIVDRLLLDWVQQTLGLKDTFLRLVSRAGTRYLRGRRNAFNQAAAFPLGDVLLYQSEGESIRSFIRSKIEGAAPPVTVVAHSLGGIASVDLLAAADGPSVYRLVTLGSQSPYLYEIGALHSLPTGSKLRTGFPPWLNVYDRNDFLSFVAERLFPSARDFETTSGQPFPESHSAYFGNEAVWQEIRKFIDGSER
jgi:hypothetical protein